MLRTTDSDEYILTSNEMRKMYDFLKEKEYDDPIMSIIGSAFEAEDRKSLTREEYSNMSISEVLNFAEISFEVKKTYKLGNRAYKAIDREGHSCINCALTTLCELNLEFCRRVKCDNPKDVRHIIFEEV